MIESFKKVSNHIEKCIISLNSPLLNPAKLFTITLESIEFIEHDYQTLNGREKKLLLIEAMNDICDHSINEKLTLEMKMTLKNFVNEDLSTIIDSIIQISNGEYHINEKQQVLVVRYLIKLCEFLFKKCMKQKKQTRKNLVNNP
jgi:hypothetical protein